MAQWSNALSHNFEPEFKSGWEKARKLKFYPCFCFVFLCLKLEADLSNLVISISIVIIHEAQSSLFQRIKNRSLKSQKKGWRKADRASTFLYIQQ